MELSDDTAGKWQTASEKAEIAGFQSWEFNIWNVDKSHFKELTMCIMNQYNLPMIYQISSVTWSSFIDEVMSLMSNNPYHNFHHIIDVMQSTSCIIKEFSGNRFLSDLDILALLVAAIIHDLEHPGTNNVYQVNAATPLAIRYNDISVLENHHASKAFEIFQSDKTNIFANLTPDQYKYVRKTIISIVLSTDMTTHFALKAELEECYIRYQTLTSNPDASTTNSTNGSTGRSSFRNLPVTMTPADTLTIMKSILHAADISNPAKKWILSKIWSDRVLEEFFQQGDREKKENLPVSMNCDRNITKQDELSVNFCDFIVAPFFFSLTKLLPKTLVACRELRVNRTIWHNMICARLKADDEAKLAEMTSNGTAPVPAVNTALASWEARQLDFSNKFNDLANKYDVLPAPLLGSDDFAASSKPVSARRLSATTTANSSTSN